MKQCRNNKRRLFLQILSHPTCIARLQLELQRFILLADRGISPKQISEPQHLEDRKVAAGTSVELVRANPIHITPVEMMPFR
ncbi:hypothetical protein NS212_12000 [Pseudomonas parafulva]|nr:hypothetical protein NS212_12000 [Pseudomonas parafulva]